MSFPTPTNSILNRDESDVARMSQVIYENESLKIQIETLQEKLQSTGLLKLENLRHENENLRSEGAKLQVQLDEKTAQLERYTSSDDRFSNIDESLHELLTQIRTQRTELAGMKDLTREKDARIAELTGLLNHSETELKEARTQLTAASADTAQQNTQAAEANALREQVAQLSTEVETLRRASEEEAAGLQKDLTAAQSELLALKADAATKSAVKGQRMTSQEQDMAACREREASSQRQVVELQARMEMLRTECSQLRETQADLQRRLQQQQQQAVASSAVANACKLVDLYCPEVKAHVEKAVQNATEGIQRRLREQVEQNTSLLSRMALIQQESEDMMKSKGMSNHEVTVMKERVDIRTRRNEARHSMQRRVAELLSGSEVNKKDIELLLQEMLDYQEEQDQENRTMLLVKDMEAEERERALRRELKRIKDENASLMKQLQQLAMEGFHRDRSNSQSGTMPSPREAGAPPAALPTHNYGAVPVTMPAPPAATSQRNPPSEQTNTVSEPAYSHATDRQTAVGANPPLPGPNAAPPSLQQTPPPQRRPPHHFGGDLWSNTPSRSTELHAQPLYTQLPGGHIDPQQHQPQPQHAFSGCATGAGASPDPNRNVMVHCPACTYKQRYGNHKCEICEAVLKLN
ncbi:hypothetical protein ABB37_03304 [Leptomonas pyrrhocoris]|uniref:Uncharacterized protein n=1 Tax=Leptomonas pyrrhocoris TaxID=157538 RepID=A0A0M9G4W0_LEPPY|nr:hypothetical protein ABB37_03304 [Leptomonas pyrrhocoris]KPA82176.1 hypothetical protein ABB37_03304 [Leptomonas pyrrhocoris]|eukprot:XP_015660615.1 hypothetical protein ABB37_03304 [Leptomonas pyrrhocoris]